MRNITPVDTFTAPVSVLEDTDPVSESSTQPTIQALTNRTENSNSRLNVLGTKDAASGVVGLDANKHAAIAASGGNATALTAAGNGTGAGISTAGGATGPGITAQGGATSGAGVVGTGTATGSVGVAGTGVGAGSGVTGQGGATGPGVTGTGGASGGAGVSATGTVGQPGVTAQGGPSGNGVTATGGASSGSGVVGNGSGSGTTGVIGNAGSGNGIGVVGNGSGTAEGARFFGGTSNGDGVRGTGGATNGIGVVGFGAGTGAGGYFDGQGNGLAATDDAIVLLQNIKFQGSNPANTTGFSNRLTALNVPKAFGRVLGGGGSAPSYIDGFNSTASRVDTATLQISFVTAMADANYCIILGEDLNGYTPTVQSRDANGFTVKFYDAPATPNATTSGKTVEFCVFGRQ